MISDNGRYPHLVGYMGIVEKITGGLVILSIDEIGTKVAVKGYCIEPIDYE